MESLILSTISHSESQILNNFLSGPSFYENEYFEPVSDANKMNVHRMNESLQKQDFAAIIHDKELFRLAYGQAVILDQNHEEMHQLNIHKEAGAILFEGHKYYVSEIKNIIENIRTFALENFKQMHKSKLLVVKKSGLCKLKIADPNSDIYNKEWKILCNKGLYKSHVEPILPSFFESLGAIYSAEIQQKMVVASEFLSASLKAVTVISVEWKNDKHLVYPIAPRPLAATQPLQKILYDQYKKQKYCDFNLICADGDIAVHALVLSNHPVFEKMIDADLLENRYKKIAFTDHSQSTVQAFVDFIYLGAKEFSEKIIASESAEEINLLALFELAHLYQLDSLIDCCTNLLSLFADQTHLTDLEALAETYNNEHLHQLCLHLAKQNM